MSSSSLIFLSCSDRSSARRLRRSDLELGEILGTGAYSDVHEARIVKGKKLTQKEEDDDDDWGTPRFDYALKQLRKEIINDPSQKNAAFIDLAVEARMLASFNNENIVKLYAVVENNDAFSSNKINRCCEPYRLLLMERLQGTLSGRIEEWRKEEMQYRTGIKALVSRGYCLSKREGMLFTRLKVATDISKGLAYLHSCSIVYRDLKPENIGFDTDGKIKIFDFGLAKEIDNNGGNKKMTGLIGTYRYMAPEVAKCDNYGLSADVYSFGILLW
eukprot:CAMPEP_0197436180 /NCGR_PEP_ID=MMETSP1175-20131217/3650_1 /TAXON_ID=1003142 /ORGANISM="Triceratium dubium, Strain CCMP147" /LENGTH=272 /DNA_ID=CAMNT_0042965409 /DNA_START=262 /DNA_END=1077 /DNA_ORIENTATION=+